MRNLCSGPLWYCKFPGVFLRCGALSLLAVSVMFVSILTVPADAQKDFLFQRGSISLERSTSYRRDSKDESIAWDITVKLQGKLKSVSKKLQNLKGRPFRTQVLEISSLDISLFEGRYSYSIMAYDSEKGEHTEEGICHITHPGIEGFAKDVIVFFDAEGKTVRWIGVPAVDLSYEWAGSEYCTSEYDRVDYYVEPLEDNQGEDYNDAVETMIQQEESPEQDSGEGPAKAFLDLTEQYVNLHSNEPFFRDYIVTSGDGVRSFGGGGETFSEERSGNSHTTVRESFNWLVQKNR